MRVGLGSGFSEAVRYCLQRRHLRRTIAIALVVGAVLTAINQLDVILRGETSSAVALKVVGNFLVPFVVSNLGLLSGRAAGRGPDRGAG